MCKRNPFQIPSPGTCGLLLLSPKTICPFVDWLLSSALGLECASGKADGGYRGAETGTSAVARPGYPSSGDPAIAAGPVQQRCNNGATKASPRAPAVAGKGLAAVPSRGRSCAPVGFLHEPQGVSDNQQEIVLLQGLVEQGHHVARWLDAVALVIFLGEVDAKVQPAGEPRLLDMLRNSNMRC